MIFINLHADIINLIDADTVVNIACFSFKETVTAREVHNRADEILSNILEQTRCANYQLVLSALDKDNFRYKIAKTPHPSGGLGYKVNRKGERPEHYNSVREYLLETCPTVLVRGREADDYIMEKATENKDKYIISCDDKDMFVYTGTLHNIRTGELQPYTYDNDFGGLELTEKRKLKGRGIVWFYAQMIMGDTIDNIPGIPKKGDVAAFNLLKECETELDAYLAVLAAYKEAFEDDGIDRYFEIGQLLWIQQHNCSNVTKRWQRMFYGQ